MDLNDIPIFLKVAETGSFTAAARGLGLPKTTVSRRVARLEDAVGIRLLQRTTRSLHLTDAGRRYFEACSVAMAAVDQANRRTAEMQEEPSGTIRISGPADTGFLADTVTDFMALYPKVSMEVVLTDHALNLVEEGIDVAIRAGRLSDSSLVARKLAPSRRAFVASPDYLATRGVPETPADLARHDCIVFGRTIEGATWLIRGAEGPETIAVRGRIAVNTVQFAIRAAVAGLGVALIPSPLAGQEIRQGRLRTVLEDYEPPHGGLYAIYPSNRHMPVAVTTFVDFVAERTGWLRATGAMSPEGPPPADGAEAVDVSLTRRP